MRWIAHGLLFVALVAGVFGLLPRLGGLTHDAAGLRHARPAFLAAAIVAQALSLGCYALLYRQVLAALGARVRFRLAADVILATFFVSHLTPFGSATGTLVNASTLETEGIAAATTGEAIALTSLTSAIALIVLFGTGLAATAGRHVSHQYLVIAGIAMFLIVLVLAAVLAVGSARSSVVSLVSPARRPLTAALAAASGVRRSWLTVASSAARPRSASATRAACPARPPSRTSHHDPGSAVMIWLPVGRFRGDSGHPVLLAVLR